MQEFSTIGLIGRNQNQEIVDSLIILTDFLKSQPNLEIVLDEAVANLLATHLEPNSFKVCHRDDMHTLCDLAIVVGGDGTMLETASSLADQNIPVLGINRGRLGFLTDILPHEIEHTIKQVLQGQYKLESRFLLDVSVNSPEQESGRSALRLGSALNDVVLHPGVAAQMIEFELYIDGEFVYNQASDGLIVATPTGSTAYSMSAGGPIMHPKLDALLLVPMYPHSLSSRPIVIAGGSEVTIVVVNRQSIRQSVLPQISCDGGVEYTTVPGDRITVKKKEQHLTLVHPENYNYYETCRSKLAWSHRLSKY